MNHSYENCPDPATRSKVRRSVVVAAILLAAILGLGPAAAADSEICVVADIHALGWDDLQKIKGDPGVSWWIEFGGELVLCADTRAAERIGHIRAVSIAADVSVNSPLWLVRGFNAHELEDLGLRLAVGAPRFGLVTAPDLDARVPFQPQVPEHREIFPVEHNTVVVQQAVNRQPREGARFSPEIQALVDEVDGDRWMVDLTTLASYNRYTHGPQIDLARDWLVTQFEAMPGLTVTTPSFWVQSTLAYNVVATLEGTAAPDEWYIIGGHYDSTSDNPYVSAPGAEDNASGCAGVLEMARILTAHPTEATVMFICYSGEEQYLYGSYAHVDELIASGNLWKVQGMLDLDMIGFTSDSDLDCLLETDPFAQGFLDLFADAAALYTSLRIETDLWAGGSDHVPYLDAGVPAVLTIENDWYLYPWYHTTNDLPQHITVAMGREILKMNIAVMADLARASVGVDFSDGFESGDTSAWTVTVP